MAEDAKVEDDDKSRLRKALKQLRKDREEERAAQELLGRNAAKHRERGPRASESEGICARSSRISCSHGKTKQPQHENLADDAKQ